MTPELRWGHTPDNAMLGEYKWGSRLYKPEHDRNRPRVDKMHSWTPPAFRDLLLDLARSARVETARVILGRVPQDTLFNVQETQPKACQCGAKSKESCRWTAERDRGELAGRQPRSCLLRHDPATAPLPEGF